MLNLDTHMLVFAVQGELKLAERRLLSETSWSISSIVLWELAKLAQLGRVNIDIDDFKGDPADEIIAATSVVHDVPLLTRDRVIRRSKIVPLAS